MITLQEIRKRLKVPYKYEAPYYIFQGKCVGDKKYDVTLNWYDVHTEDTFYNDILTYIAPLPDRLRAWIMKRIADENGVINDTTEHVITYIDVAHFGYYGVFAE